jgi:hypothetical protein
VQDYGITYYNFHFIPSQQVFCIFSTKTAVFMKKLIFYYLAFLFVMPISRIAAQTSTGLCADTAYTPKRIAGDAQKVSTTMQKGSVKNSADEEFLPALPTCDELYDFFEGQEKAVRTLLINKNLTQEMLTEAVMIVETLRHGRKLAVKCEKPVQDYMDATITSLDESIATVAKAKNFTYSASLDELKKLYTIAEQAIAQAGNNPLMLEAAKQAFETFNVQMQVEAQSVMPESDRKALEAQKTVLEERLKKIVSGTNNKLIELTALHDVAADAIVAAENALDAQTLKAAKEALDKFDTECKNKIKFVEPEIEQKTLEDKKAALQTKMQTLTERAESEVPKRIAGDAQINCYWEVEFTVPKRYNKDKRMETVGSPDSLLKAELLAIKKAAKTPENLARTIKKLQKKHSKIVFIEIPEKPIGLEMKLTFGKYKVKNLGEYSEDFKYSVFWRLDSAVLTTTPNENFKFSLDSARIDYNCPYTPQQLSYWYKYDCKLNFRVLDLPAFRFFLANNPEFAKTFMESDIDESITKYPFVFSHIDEQPIYYKYNHTFLTFSANLNKKGVRQVNKVNTSPLLDYMVRDIPLDHKNGLIKVKHNEKKVFKNLEKQVLKLYKR